MFADEEFVKLSLVIGRAAAEADSAQISILDRLYWYTLEFGLIEETDGVRAYGAGLLSSFGELSHAFTPEVAQRPFEIEEVVSTPYNYSSMQPLLFVIPSFGFLREQIERLLASPMYLKG